MCDDEHLLALATYLRELSVDCSGRCRQPQGVLLGNDVEKVTTSSLVLDQLSKLYNPAALTSPPTSSIEFLCSHPAMRLILDTARSHLQTHCDGGWRCVFLITRIIERSNSMLTSSSSSVLWNHLSHVSSWLSEAERVLAKTETTLFERPMPGIAGVVHQIESYLVSSGIPFHSDDCVDEGLGDEYHRNLAIDIVRVLLNTTSSNKSDDDNNNNNNSQPYLDVSRINVSCVVAKHPLPRVTVTFPGIAIPLRLCDEALSLWQQDEPRFADGGEVLLFDCDLQTTSGENPRELCRRITGLIAKRPTIRFVACQRTINAVLRFELSMMGVMPIECLSIRFVHSVRRATGAQLLGSWRTLPLEAESSVIGKYVGAVKRFSLLCDCKGLEDDGLAASLSSGYLIDGSALPFSTVVVPIPFAEYRADTEVTIKNAMSIARLLLMDSSTATVAVKQRNSITSVARTEAGIVEATLFCVLRACEVTTAMTRGRNVATHQVAAVRCTQDALRDYAIQVLHLSAFDWDKIVLEGVWSRNAQIVFRIAAIVTCAPTVGCSPPPDDRDDDGAIQKAHEKESRIQQLMLNLPRRPLHDDGDNADDPHQRCCGPVAPVVGAYVSALDLSVTLLRMKGIIRVDAV
eukprot:PhM_4_TR13290/c0_g1_i4/m.92098